jgi:2-isopropylmalate synthase
MLKDRRTYEIIRPEDVGVPTTTLVLGKHSGRHAVAQRCHDLGFALDARDLDRVYRSMIVLADRVKTISDDDLRTLVHEVWAEEPEAGSRALRSDRKQHHEMGYGHGV